MKKMKFVRSVMVGALLAAYGAGAAAQAVDEVEPNFPIATPQALTMDNTGSATVTGYIGDADADVYAFEAKAGSDVIFDIDNGIQSDGSGVDTYLTLLGPAPTHIWLDGKDDADAMDAGSISPYDSYIKYRIPADGTYYVAVTGAPNNLADGGKFVGGSGNTQGTYTLIISGVLPLQNEEPTPDPTPDPTPQIQSINIDIKPGRSRITRIDPASKRSIPVALLSSKDFDATNVDLNSLTFGSTGDEQSLQKCNRRGFDVSGDGLPDLICHFNNHRAGFVLTDDHATVKGMTKDGTQFEGSGPLKVIPYKRKSHRWHDGRQNGRDDHDRRDRRGR